jgi:hypothetical protein
VPIFALSGQGGGGIPSNPDLTVSTVTLPSDNEGGQLTFGINNNPTSSFQVISDTLVTGADAVIVTLKTPATDIGAPLACGSLSLLEPGNYNTTGPAIINSVGGSVNISSLNVSSINGATPGGGGGGGGPNLEVSTLSFPFTNQTTTGVINMRSWLTINDPSTSVIQCFGLQTDIAGVGPPYTNNISSINVIYINGPQGGAFDGSLNLAAGADGNCYIGVGNGSGGTSTLSICAEAVGISSLLVSSINGVAPGGGGGGATISTLGLAAPFNTGPSTTVIVQEPASPSPPTQFTTMFDLQPNTLYNIAASLNYQFSNSITNSNVYMGMRLTSAPAQVIFAPSEVYIGYGNVQGFAPSWTFATGNSTISGVQMDLLLQFENNVDNVSSFITPPATSGYSATLTTLGTLPG